MSAREQMELDIIAKILTENLSRDQGQQILGVSERTLRRYLGDYEKEGVLFVKHGNCNQSPVNSVDGELKKKVLELVREKYFDFNMTHCLEKLQTDEGIEVKRETFRKWCHEIQMVKKARRRKSKVRKRRQRMQQTGIMLQMDGSHHVWFGSKPTCLIGAIDDADSDVPYAEFFASEDTMSCMKVLQRIVERRGLFQILYVDRAGIFGGSKRAHFSQVKRALRELGIYVIFAQSPEGKGRIERLWQTFQDRLIPEMRLRNIRNYETANHFLQEHFIPNEYAPHFKVLPENLQTAYKPIPPGIDLNEVFCIKEYRTVKRDHTFSLEGEILQIDSPLKHSIHRQKIEVRTYQDFSLRFFFAGKPIEVSPVKQPQKIAPSQIIRDLNKVRLDGHVVYQDCYYSVDEKYVGEKVSVFEEKNELRFYSKGKLIETHGKNQEEGLRHITKPEHQRPWRRALEKTSIYRQAAMKLGIEVDRMVMAILEQGQGFVDTQTLWGILEFEKTYDVVALNEACKCALALDHPTYAAVKMLLKLQGTRHEQGLQAQEG